MTESRANVGWESDFPTFRQTQPLVIRERLREFVSDASDEQVRAWGDSIPPLQREVEEVLLQTIAAREYSAILEYQLPMEARRPDVILLITAGILVVELKGHATPTRAALDQVAAYARDLRAYHRECHDRPVIPVLVPTRARGYVQEMNGVHVTGPDALDDLIARITARHGGSGSPPPPSRDAFLAADAYCPLPTLVKAARELFASGSLRPIHRARAATDPAVDTLSRIVHTAAKTRSRHLVLLSGVPGAGKTLVGLRIVHAKFLDDLAVDRGTGKPTAPAVFLSGNGPLVDVLQYELRAAGGDGKTFVRGVKDYIARYSARRKLVPPEHVLVFDEAQRAFDTAMMRTKHGSDARSEPEEFIGFADRVPDWCVVVGLIGSGQEIHVGEEGGIGQWRTAVEAARQGDWTVHLPPAIAPHFEGSPIPCEVRAELNLTTELRFHAARHLHEWVAGMLDGAEVSTLAALAAQLERDGLHLRMTRSLDDAKAYLRERYADNPDARFGLLASSKDKDLSAFGIPNDYQSTKRLKFGPWYGDGEDAEGGRSCRHLKDCVTEFGAQGLELDGALLAWGTDLQRRDGSWSNERARGYKKGAPVRDPRQLRINAYRVLLTRGRDGTVIYLPALWELEETWTYLRAAGVTTL